MSREEAHRIAAATSQRFPRMPIHTVYVPTQREWGWATEDLLELAQATTGAYVTQTYCGGTATH